MRRRFQLHIMVILMVLFAVSLPASAEVYTLERCVNIALENNYGVIASKNLYSSARGEVYSAWGNVLPSISISASGNRNWSARGGYDRAADRFYVGKSVSYSGALDFSQTYPGLGIYTYANIKKARHDRESSFSGYLNSRNTLVLDIKSKYYNLLKAKMLLEVSKDAVKRGEERLRVVQSRYDLGSASMSDVLKAKVQYGNDRLDQVSRSNGLKLAQAELAYTMGIDVNEEFEVDENLPEQHIDISFESALSEALSRNPECRRAGFDLSSARDAQLIAYSLIMPSIRIGLTHYTSGFNELSRLTNFDKIDASYYLYTTVSFNIFNNGSDYARLRTARNTVKTQRENLENTKNAVALEIKRAFLDLERSEEAKKLAKESVAAAQEDLNLVREKYKLGAATILEVLDAEVSFKQAQTSHVEVLYDYNLAVSRLEKALGR